jgi:hypothetical protein
MAGFGGTLSELDELIAYERDALEFLRAALFDQHPPSDGGGLEIDLSKPKTSEGHFPVNATLTMRGFSSADEAVKAALSRLRPLAFAAAFKMHDMIAEWVLRANGSHSWRFVEKVSDYRRLQGAGSLAQPPVLANWPAGAEAFWVLYETLAPFRNQLTHGGSFNLSGDVLEIRDRNGSPLVMSDKSQGAYLRYICWVADYAVSGRPFGQRATLIAENDLYELRSVHALTSLTPRSMRFTSVKATALATLGADGRARVLVNFDDIRKSAERVLPVPTGGVLVYELTLAVQADNRTLVWLFPDLSAPTGDVTVVEGDPRFESFRVR